MMAVIPYPGELYILNKLLDGIIDVNGERSVEEQQKLFVVGTVCDLAIRPISLIPSAPKTGSIVCPSFCVAYLSVSRLTSKKRPQDRAVRSQNTLEKKK